MESESDLSHGPFGVFQWTVKQSLESIRGYGAAESPRNTLRLCSFFRDAHKSFGCSGGTLSDWSSLFIDLEYPTIFPIPDMPYVGGNGIGYVDPYQPFHENMYSASDRVTSESHLLLEILLGLGTFLLQNQGRIRPHIR